MVEIHLEFVRNLVLESHLREGLPCSLRSRLVFSANFNVIL